MDQCSARKCNRVINAKFFHHVDFLTPEQMHAFYEAALAAGGKDDGAPGPRLHYSKAYYGCFVRDLDGHKIEAMA